MVFMGTLSSQRRDIVGISTGYVHTYITDISFIEITDDKDIISHKKQC